MSYAISKRAVSSRAMEKENDLFNKYDGLQTKN